MNRYKWMLILVVLTILLISGCAVSEDTQLDSAIQIETTSVIEQEETVPDVTLPVSEVSVPPDTMPEETAAEPTEDMVETEPWYNISRLIHHACGGINGTKYTNSLEAMERTLSKGNLLVEVDFLFTSDGQLICAHKWDQFFRDKENCTLEEFLQLKVKKKYTPLTAGDIIGYMEKYPSLYIIVDTKEPDLTGVVAELLLLCESRPDIADRFVIQLYEPGQKGQIQALYPFRNENLLFTCYKFGEDRASEVLELCRDEQIQIVTVPYNSWSQKTVDLFLEEGMILFEHTVNSTEKTKLSLKKGIYGFYTDFLQEEDLPVMDQGK